MSDLVAFLYGVIQGISEFAPVSSSGHLALLPHVIGFKDPGVAFDLAMHIGTALSVMIYFFPEIKRLNLSLYRFLFNRVKDERFYFLVNFIISTIATVILVVLLKDISANYARTPNIIAFNLIFFGILMWAADHFYLSKDHISMNNLSYKRAFFIGLAQAIAVFPGVSRSGITLTASRMFNITRIESARYSFLLSLPIILAGAAYKAPQIMNHTDVFSFSELIIGVITSFIFGLVTIHFFLKILKRYGLGSFAIYRIIIAVLVILYA